MIRETTKTIHFPFEFQYPRAGHQDMADAITVCEPNYDKRQVYITMRGYMGEVQNGLMKLYADPNIAKLVVDARARQAAAPKEEEAPSEETSGDGDDSTLLDQMQRVLGVDGFAKVYDYLQKQLTNCKSLAFIGSDTSLPIKDREPVTELVWMNIVAAGGMQAVDQVLGAFADFFTGTTASRSTPSATTGASSPSLPLVSPTEESKSPRRSRSQSQS